MDRRAVSFITTNRAQALPNGQIINNQQEKLKVFPIDTSLRDLFAYCRENEVLKIVIAYETEEPRPDEVLALVSSPVN